MRPAWFDVAFTCSTCKQRGFPCKCVSACGLCGFIYNNRTEKHCTHRVHQFDAEVDNAFRNGYWRIDPESGRLYKTAASSKQHIYQELDKGNVFFSRKEFNALMRKVFQHGTQKAVNEKIMEREK